MLPAQKTRTLQCYCETKEAGEDESKEGQGVSASGIAWSYSDTATVRKFHTAMSRSLNSAQEQVTIYTLFLTILSVV